MNRNCSNCKHDGESEYCANCVVRPVGSTHAPDKWENDGSYINADHIRAMSDEELAESFATTFCHGYGQPQLLSWLRQPWEGAPHG